ncbi:MAG: glycosyltransferase family 39 protein, partial [Chloroflexi bacterium]|nr:glycosyltransferase family 39 protein [Chloroflexota bacterium]
MTVISRGPSFGRASGFVAPLLLLAYGLRVTGLQDLSMAGDSSAQTYNAGQNLVAITFQRLVDGHPPLSFYLLHGWMLAGGNSELSARLFSVSFGIAGVAVAYVLGKRLAGPRPGLVAAALVALAPDLVYHDRLIRMYGGLGFFALLTTYLLVRLKRPSRAMYAAYAAATFVAVLNHYYAILLTIAQALWWLLARRGAWREWLAVYGGVSIAYAPWLAFAAPAQMAMTSAVISQYPPAQGWGGFLEELWLPFAAGFLTPRLVALPLALILAAAVAVAAGILIVRRARPSGLSSRGLAAPLACLLGTIALTAIAFAAFPAAVRPRQLIVALPLWLMVLVGLVEMLWRVRPWLGIGLLLPALA